MRIGRTAIALVAMALLATACGGIEVVQPLRGDEQGVQPEPSADAEPGIEDPAVEASMQATLDAVAEAFVAADPHLLRPWLHDPASDFGVRWLARANNLSDVPLSTYALVLDPSLGDLATGRVRARFADREVQVRYVVEEHALEGFDQTGPAADDLFLTLALGDDGVWRVASDADAEALGLVSVDHLWDHGPVVVSGAPPIAALHHPGMRNIDEVLVEARSALELIGERWPLPWPEAVPILVPRDQDELGELLHVTFDLSNFVAFAVATPSGELGEYELTGNRIMINPDRFLDRSSATRESILAHELLHVATRPHAGPMTPSWVEEGVAQRLGELRSTTGLGLVGDLIARGVFDGEVPDDADFTTGGRDRIFLSYQLAYSFFDHLVRRFGAQEVGEFYAALGRGSVGQAGREGWHVERALREVFGESLDELRATWVADLTG